MENFQHINIQKALHNWNEEEENIFWEKYYTSMLPKMSAKALASESIKELSKNNKIYLITARWDTEKRKLKNNYKMVSR